MNRLPGSDILAHASACDPKTGTVTSEVRNEVMERTQEYFLPELLNRLDMILVFNKLSHESILAVDSLRLDDVAHRLKNRRISLDVDGASKDWLAQHGYSEIYGARAIARVVRTDVLFPLARKLLRGTIRYVSFKFTFSSNKASAGHFFFCIKGRRCGEDPSGGIWGRSGDQGESSSRSVSSETGFWS